MNTHSVVVDVSLAVKWVLDEIHSDEARALQVRWAREDVRVIAPGWFACELANILHHWNAIGGRIPRVRWIEQAGARS